MGPSVLANSPARVAGSFSRRQLGPRPLDSDYTTIQEADRVLGHLLLELPLDLALEHHPGPTEHDLNCVIVNRVSFYPRVSDGDVKHVSEITAEVGPGGHAFGVTVIFLGWASAFLGTVMVTTPSALVALTLSASTPGGKVMAR